MADQSESAALGSPRRAEDRRYQRVRAKLVSAVLQLAAEKPAEDISVSELTAAAGVSRTTFYSHGESPAAFLAQHLIREIDPVLGPLARIFDQAGPQYVLRWSAIMRELLEHVRQNRAVYEHVFRADGQSVVLSMLSVYFEEVFTQYVQTFREHVDGPPPTDFWVAMATSQQVHNTIALIASWLRTDMQETPDQVIAAYMSLVPPWQLARFTSNGRTTLRRNRIVAELLAEPSAADSEGPRLPRTRDV